MFFTVLKLTWRECPHPENVGLLSMPLNLAQVCIGTLNMRNGCRGQLKKRIKCLCPGGALRQSDLRKHFRTRHPRCTLAFKGESDRVLCPDCGRSIAQAQLTQLTRHRASSECQQHQTRTRRLRGIEHTQAALTIRFHIGEQQLEEAHVFKYLGKPSTPPYCTENTAVQYNIKKARRKWTML